MDEYIKRFMRIVELTPSVERARFMSSYFKTRPEDIVDGESVSFDIVRRDENIAPVVRNYRAGPSMVSEDLYVNKELPLAFYSMGAAVNVYDMMKRQPGETEYAAVGSWSGRLMKKLADNLVSIGDQLHRAVEKQCAQVMQTAQLDLPDDSGTSTFTVDYKPKASHFPTVTTPWSSTGSADPIGDLTALMDTVKSDGLVDVRTAIMGSEAYRNFIKNPDVLALLEKEQLNLGAINPRQMNGGGTYMGHVFIGGYRLDIFTYDGMYVPETGTGVKQRYLDPVKVVLVPDSNDLDFRMVYGSVPNITDKANLFREFIPRSITREDGQTYYPRVYADTKADVITGEIRMRALAIPASIDRYGCLTTEEPAA